jgi:acid phosphatase type 7
MTVSWVNSELLSSSEVKFGTDACKLTTTATGTGATYTQNLAPLSTNLVTPKMGAPGAKAADILALANSSTYAYDRDATGRKWAYYKNVRSYVPGQLSYNNPYAYYDSPIIHTTVLTDLVAGQKYYYQPAGASKVYSFTMLPAVTTYPFKAALVADLGTTAVSAMSVSVLEAMKASVVIFTGDLCYADGWTPTWDVFGIMVEPLISTVPMLSVGGNHEFFGENWQSYAARYKTNPEDSASPNFCYHGREVGPLNIISLCSYGAANFAGINTGSNSLQFQWLTNYLATVDRTRTPWLMVQFHVPMYCTNTGHYKEGEIFRRQYEPLLYKYGVDIVMNGHIHAYERTFPMYNNTVDPCGITHLILGDGGNFENAYVPWIDPVKPWSAFREASFGVASLTVLSATQANYTWHRHACGSLSTGPPNYAQNFSKSCVTPGDNSANVALSVDSYIMTKPSKEKCPNRYKTKEVTAANNQSPTSSPSPASLSATLSGSSLSGSCFAGTETVELESGSLKYISDVQVGDRVLAAAATGKTSFSEVQCVLKHCFKSCLNGRNTVLTHYP